MTKSLEMLGILRISSRLTSLNCRTLWIRPPAVLIWKWILYLSGSKCQPWATETSWWIKQCCKDATALKITHRAWNCTTAEKLELSTVETTLKITKRSSDSKISNLVARLNLSNEAANYKLSQLSNHFSIKKDHKNVVPAPTTSWRSTIANAHTQNKWAITTFRRRAASPKNHSWQGQTWCRTLNLHLLKKLNSNKQIMLLMTTRPRWHLMRDRNAYVSVWTTCKCFLKKKQKIKRKSNRSTVLSKIRQSLKISNSLCNQPRIMTQKSKTPKWANLTILKKAH